MPQKRKVLISPIIEIPIFVSVCTLLAVLFYYTAFQDYKEPTMSTVKSTKIRGKVYLAIFLAKEPISIGQLAIDIQETESSTKVAVKSLLKFRYLDEHVTLNGKVQRYFYSAKKTEFDLRRVLLDSEVGDRILFDRATNDFLQHCLCNYNQMSDKPLPLTDEDVEESYSSPQDFISPFSSSTLVIDPENFM